MGRSTRWWPVPRSRSPGSGTSRVHRTPRPRARPRRWSAVVEVRRMTWFSGGSNPRDHRGRSQRRPGRSWRKRQPASRRQSRTVQRSPFRWSSCTRPASPRRALRTRSGRSGSMWQRGADRRVHATSAVDASFGSAGHFGRSGHIHSSPGAEAGLNIVEATYSWRLGQGAPDRGCSRVRRVIFCHPMAHGGGLTADAPAARRLIPRLLLGV
jgi:hypothetical protein